MNLLSFLDQWRADFIKDYWECPYCMKIFRLDSDQMDFSYLVTSNDENTNTAAITLSGTFWCPDCLKPSIYLSDYVNCTISRYNNVEFPDYNGDEIQNSYTMIYPEKRGKNYPEYIPEPIRRDYLEAVKIVNHSPKASATLARRCLQGMLVDKWTVSKQKKLYAQIDEIRDRVTEKTFNAIDAVRKIGNIGAHMKNPNVSAIDDSPITASDAEVLIALIEVLIKTWYTDPVNEDRLMDKIISREHVLNSREFL